MAEKNDNLAIASVAIGVIGLYLVWKQTHVSGLTNAVGQPIPAPPVAYPTPVTSTAFNPAANQAEQIATGALAKIPIVGGLLSSISGALLSASKQRAAEAVSENSAVGKFIPYFDSELSQIMAAASAGQLSPGQASQALSQLMQAYYSSVTPHIQPGRNGCAGGGAAKPQVGGPPGHGACSATNGYYGCGNDKTWGAACCIGSVLGATIANMQFVLSQPNGGQAVACEIFGDKYGGASRAGYTITYTPPKGSLLASFHL